MSTDLFYFTTIVGETGAAIAALCDDIVGRRRQIGVNEGEVVFPERDDLRIERLCKAVIELAVNHEFPLVHVATHLDRWATRNWSLGNIKWPDGVKRAIYGDDYGIACYRKHHAESVLREVAARRRRETRAGRPIDAWYEDAVATAIHAGKIFPLDYTVVTISQIAGSSGLDSEVFKSATRIPALVKKAIGTRRSRPRK